MNTLIKQSQQGAYSVTEVDIVDEEKVAELENAKLVFTPEFTPYYHKEIKKYKFNYLQGLLYGFLRFYLSSSSNSFYFTNLQLADLFECSEVNISRSIQPVLSCGEFKIEYKMKANGGKYRLIKSVNFDITKMLTSSYQKRYGNKNKLKENKLNNVENKFSYSETLYNKEETQRIKKSKQIETEKLLGSKSQYQLLKEKGIV